MVSYLTGGFFGEYQCIMGLFSRFCYRSDFRSNSPPVYLFYIDGKKFLEMLQLDPNALIYLTEIGLQKRSYLNNERSKVDFKFQNKIPSSLYDNMFGLKKKETT